MKYDLNNSSKNKNDYFYFFYFSVPKQLKYKSIIFNTVCAAGAGRVNTKCRVKVLLTLLEAASGMHPEWQGGAFKAPPVKTSLEAILTQVFDITLIGGQK